MTPDKCAEYLLEALDGDKKELISFDYFVHVVEAGSRNETSLLGTS